MRIGTLINYRQRQRKVPHIWKSNTGWTVNLAGASVKNGTNAMYFAIMRNGGPRATDSDRAEFSKFKAADGAVAAVVADTTDVWLPSRADTADDLIRHMGDE